MADENLERFALLLLELAGGKTMYDFVGIVCVDDNFTCICFFNFSVA